MQDDYNPNIHPQMPEVSQVPQPPFFPPMPMWRKPRTWRERMMHRFGMDTAVQMRKGARTIPDWLMGWSVIFFFVSLFACWAVFGYVPDATLWITAAISVILFFYGGMTLSRLWSKANERQFLRNIFITGFAIRLLWVFYCYFIFNPEYYYNTFGEEADVEWYVPFAKSIALALSGDSGTTFIEAINNENPPMDDLGYPLWLGIVYWIFGVENDVFIPFVIKCIVSAYCALCIYHIAKRHFGDGVARMAAIFVCINPNMIYWCGNLFKESEMVFFVCVAVENFDKVLNSGNRFTFKSLLPGVIAGIALMFYRSALGLAFFFAVFFHLAMASKRVMSTGKKIIAGMLVGTILAIAIGDRILTQSQMLIEHVRANDQQTSMEWRSQRKDATSGAQQSFAKYAGAAIFAPLIFTIPFPTFNVADTGQLRQVQLSGGSYIKNIFSFFVIIVMMLMLVSGEWRRHVFILAYTLGYLMVLVMSPFAHSGRFHMPIWPMLMLFAAYGIQITKGNKKIRKWFPVVVVLEVFVCLVWNWFKLKGRGII